MSTGAEVLEVSPNGVHLLVDGRELFLPFEDFPWFLEAPVGAIFDVQRPQPHHLYWPQFDVDLTLDSIDHPERYPLVSDTRSSARERASEG